MDNIDLQGLKKAADLLEEVCDDMNSEIASPFRAELWKVLDKMQDKIWKLERASYNPFAMIDYTARVCGMNRR